MGIIPNSVAVGPWGGPEGEGIAWDYNGANVILTDILIRHATDVIHSISFKSRMHNGQITTSEKFGGGGGELSTVTLKDMETITGLEVMVGDYQGHSAVLTLCIKTNKTTYGPFGNKTGTRTSIPVVDGGVIGFFGRASQYLNAIGFYAVVIPKSTNPIQDNKGSKAMTIGPWGSSEGTLWTYLPPGITTKIVITFGGCIDSLIFECKGGDGAIICSKQYGGTSTAKYGGPGGHTTKEVVLDSGEYITGIDMRAGEYDGHKVINQLRIRTNRKVSDFFGEATATGSIFSIPIKDGSVVGFFGRSGLYLNAIGIYATNSSSEEDEEDKNDDKTDDEKDDKTDDEKDDNTDDKKDDSTDDKVVPCPINKISLNINISVKLNSSK